MARFVVGDGVFAYPHPEYIAVISGPPEQRRRGSKRDYCRRITYIQGMPYREAIVAANRLCRAIMTFAGPVSPADFARPSSLTWEGMEE